jgi:membrane-associated protein
MIPGVDLSTVITTLGYALPLIIFAETGLMVGFFLPGDSLLFTAGALAGLGIFHINIYLLAIIFFVAAVAGNTSGYLIGKHLGRRLFHKKESRFFKRQYLEEAEKFYSANGHKAVILAQFVPIIRTFNPIVTGISKMHYVDFIIHNVIGAAIWTLGFTLAGFFIFRAFGSVIPPEDVDRYILPIILLIIVISFIPGVIHIMKDETRREKIMRKLKFWKK